MTENRHLGQFNPHFRQFAGLSFSPLDRVCYPMSIERIVTMTLERFTRAFQLRLPQRSVNGGLYFPFHRVLVVDALPTEDPGINNVIVDISKMTSKQAGKSVLAALRRRQFIKASRQHG